MLPLTRSGPGSTVSAQELGDLLLAGVVDPMAPRWAGLGLYALPLAGAIALIGVGLPGAPGRAATIAASILASVAAVAVVLAFGGAPLVKPGSGFLVASFGVVAVLIGPLLPADKKFQPESANSTRPRRTSRQLSGRA